MASKSFDPTKFRNSLTKSIKGMSAGFNDPTDWISTGNYALNYLLSGDFRKGIPLGKVSVFAGESGAGKSYIVSSNCTKVLLPPPLAPTIATFSPGAMLKLR